MIFTYMKKIAQEECYPPTRAIHLLEAISKDLYDQLLKHLAGQDLIFQAKTAFYETIANLMAIFADWERNINQLKEIMRRMQNFHLTAKSQIFPHEILQNRLEKVQRVRLVYDKIQKTVEWIIFKEKQSKQVDF
jgi:hypothetical protein